MLLFLLQVVVQQGAAVWKTIGKINARLLKLCQTRLIWPFTDKLWVN